MLRPQDSTTRETKRLDGIWSFVVDTRGARATRRRLPTRRGVTASTLECHGLAAEPAPRDTVDRDKMGMFRLRPPAEDVRAHDLDDGGPVRPRRAVDCRTFAESADW